MGTGGTMHSLQIGDSPRSVAQRLPIYEALGRVIALAQIGPHPIDQIMFSRLEAAEHEKKTEKPKERKAEG